VHIFHFYPSIPAPTIFIVDEQGIPLLDKYYEVDSTIRLTCIVRHVSMMSSVVFWIHNNHSILNYDVTRGGIRFVFILFRSLYAFCVFILVTKMWKAIAQGCHSSDRKSARKIQLKVDSKMNFCALAFSQSNQLDIAFTSLSFCAFSLYFPV
jgi:hypothetical protein